ncbi:MAG: hypothetical protein IKF52_01455 [Clostridia bacterium]|nr:hypothetical protein [Clostridia bacterium]MBR3152190.1 hypothetical protein [Clostridia bacterium]MBR3152273.1 hypothetical protein [Clostridia bacterium]
MNNKDINTLLDMLSKMDKQELEQGINKAKQVLNNQNPENILKDLKNKP